jgi:hypothetical protein
VPDAESSETSVGCAGTRVGIETLGHWRWWGGFRWKNEQRKSLFRMTDSDG